MDNRKKKALAIKRVSFPRITDDYNEQRKEEYGRQVALAIQGEWFKREGGDSRFYNSKAEFIRRRLYARGKQSTAKYKDFSSFDGDLSYLNLDFTPVPIIPKFVDLVANGIVDRDYVLRAFSIDRESNKERQNFREAIHKDMVTKELGLKAKERLGVDLFTMNPNELPETDEELDIHTQLKFKPSSEIAQEQALSVTFEENEYDDVIRPRLIRDQIELGISAAKSTYSHSDGIKKEYVDPENLVYSFTEDPYFKDCYYFGEFKNELISNVIKEHPFLSDTQREEIADAAQQWSDYHGLDSLHDYDDNIDGRVSVLNFAYKTVRKRNWKEKKTKSNGTRVLFREDDFQIEDKEDGERDFDKLTKYEEIWFEGRYVLGTDILLQWEIMENQVRPKSSHNKVLSPFVVCASNMSKGAIDSLVDRMIPYADKIKMIDLKIQQTIQMMVPDGQFIDVDGLSEIDLGNGSSYSPTEAFDMYMQTGSIFGRSQTFAGEFNHGKVPIQEITSSAFNNKLAALASQYAFNLQQIKDVTGVNRMDSNVPDKEALVGLQKMAAYNSNVNTRHILFAFKYITQQLANLSSIRISDILEFSENKEAFIQKIGVGSVRNLDYVSKMHLYDFSIYLDFEPDEEERARLEQDIQIEIQNGNLGIEDKIDILSIKNIKYANEILKIRKKKRQKEAREFEMQKIEQQKQANIASTQASAQSDLQKKQAEFQFESKIEQQKFEQAMREMQAKYGYEQQNIKLENSYKLPIQQQQMQSQLDRDKMKEDRKDKRIKEEGNVQSKLAKQRQDNLDAIDFTEEDIDLQAFDFGNLEQE